MKDTIIAKFGGSITAFPEKIKSAVKLLSENPSRRFLIASAPGAAHDKPGITDMLFMSYSSFVSGEDYSRMSAGIAGRFKAAADSLGVKFDSQFVIDTLKKDTLKKDLSSGFGLDYIGSRGEYIMAGILADYLGWKFMMMTIPPVIIP